MIADACRALEVTAMDIFARNGWQLGFVACNLLFVSLKICNKSWIYLLDREAGILFNIPLSKKNKN